MVNLNKQAVMLVGVDKVITEVFGEEWWILPEEQRPVADMMREVVKWAERREGMVYSRSPNSYDRREAVRLAMRLNKRIVVLNPVW
jgi:hypothetical protein